MIRGVLLGSVSGLALSGLFIVAVSLVAPPPAQHPQRPVADVPEGPVLRDQAEAQPRLPEPLPERPAQTERQVAAAAPQAVAPAAGVTRGQTESASVPIGVRSQFFRPREDGAVVMPDTDNRPRAATLASLSRQGGSTIAAPTPETDSAARPAPASVSSFVSAPVAGAGPNLPNPLREGAPRTFGVTEEPVDAPLAVAAAPDTAVEDPVALPEVQTEAEVAELVEPEKQAVLAEAPEAVAPPAEEDNDVVLAEAPAVTTTLPTLTPLNPAPTDVAQTQSSGRGIKLVTGEEVIRVRPGSSASDPERQNDLQRVAPGPEPEVETFTGTPRRIVLDSEREAQDAADATDDADDEAEAQPRALDAYAAAFSSGSGDPLYSIVLIDDPAGGVSRDALTNIDLPLTFAIDPTRPDAGVVAQTYRDAGFEIIMLADALSLLGTPQDVAVAMTGAMAAVPEAVAVLDAASNGFAGDREQLQAILPPLAEGGMGFLAYPVGLNSGVTTAGKEGVPAATLYRSIDGNGEAASVIARFLDRATFEAVQDGHVVVVGRTRPDTIEALSIWRDGSRIDTVEPAPLSAVLKSTQP